MTTTSLPTVKAQLLARLQARPGLAGVQVTYVWPGGDATGDEAIWFGDARGVGTYPVMRAGRKPRDEEYTFDVFAQVLAPDSWDQTSEARALALLAELEGTVADDPNLGLTALPTLVARVANWTLTNGVLGDGGWGTVVRAQVETKSRLT